MLVVRSFLLVSALVMLALGQTGTGVAQSQKRSMPEKPANQNYVQVHVAELLQHPAEYEGRRVTVTAEVISVNARRRSLNVYDSHSRAQLGVSLAEVTKSQRRRLVAEPVRQVAVFGLFEIQDGKMLLKAEQVMPVALTLAKR
jgi:hypothetical protein